jgi:hypothetical protein
VRFEVANIKKAPADQDLLALFMLAIISLSSQQKPERSNNANNYMLWCQICHVTKLVVFMIRSNSLSKEKRIITFLNTYN